MVAGSIDGLLDALGCSIRAIQEHWLAPPYKKLQGVNRLRSVHPLFDGFGNSGMTRDVGSKVRTGRPYGGTGFIFNKKHSTCIKPLVKYKHERVSVLKLCSDIILINGYMPYFNTRDLQNQKILYQDTVAYIDNVMTEHSGAKFILLLDMNCNIYDPSHPFSIFILDLMTKYSLLSAFDRMTNFDPITCYTRSDPETNSFTLIDGILISQTLAPLVNDVRISDFGDNVSDHRPVEIDLHIELEEISLSRPRLTPTVNWSKLSSQSIETYREKMTERLDMIPVPFYTILHGDNCCNNEAHKELIQNYFHDIESAVLHADSFLPRTVPTIQKPYWSSSISELKQKSIDCCRFWRANGSPKSGPIYTCKVQCSFKYKKAIRNAKRDFINGGNDELFNNLTAHDSNAFWKLWRGRCKESDSTVTRIDGETTEVGIARAFRRHFCNVYSNHDSPSHELLRSEFQTNFDAYYREHINDSISPFYLSWADMETVISKLKLGKSSSGRIKPEHIFHGCSKLTLHLHLLFNAMIQHGMVVDDFLKGTITPIVKDAQGDVCSSSNYRGITLGSLFSKLFEFAIDLKVSPFLDADCLQFGFKKRTSTSHALYSLRSTVDYFNKHGSDVFVAFLDCSKAFDRISHYGLFSKLMARNVPLCLLLVIICWHIGLTCKVKWGEAISEEFNVPIGTKQGGITSTKYFSLYVNDLIIILRKCGFGCHVIQLFIGCILFADDLALLAPSRGALQQMIDISLAFCNKNCLDFNVKKSKVMVFGKSFKDVTLAPLSINGETVDFVQEWRYLGVTLTSGNRFGFTARPDLSSFFRATNAVLNTLKGAHEHVLLSLLYTNCVPILTYACAVKEYSSSDMSDCNVAMNNAFRKIFGFKHWQSIRYLRELFGFESLYVMFQKAQDKFLSSCKSHTNTIVNFLSSL